LVVTAISSVLLAEVQPIQPLRACSIGAPGLATVLRDFDETASSRPPAVGVSADLSVDQGGEYLSAGALCFLLSWSFAGTQKLMVRSNAIDVIAPASAKLRGRIAYGLNLVSMIIFVETHSAVLLCS